VQRVKDALSITPQNSPNFSHDPLPDHWLRVEHPEGKLYFYGKNRVGVPNALVVYAKLLNLHAQHILTQAYLYDPQILGEVETYADELWAFAEIHFGLRPDEHMHIDLVIEHEDFNDDGRPLCYYFVNHQKRILFWLKDMDVCHLMEGVARVDFISFAHCSESLCCISLQSERSLKESFART
jgi:hypothetical protein